MEGSLCRGSFFIHFTVSLIPWAEECRWLYRGLRYRHRGSLNRRSTVVRNGCQKWKEHDVTSKSANFEAPVV